MSLPKHILIREETDTRHQPHDKYLICGNSAIEMAKMGEKRIVGAYTLTKIWTIEGVSKCTLKKQIHAGWAK